jgi:hypothetical protein
MHYTYFSESINKKRGDCCMYVVIDYDTNLKVVVESEESYAT